MFSFFSPPDVLKCKKDKAYSEGQLCPMCSSPKHLKKKHLQELENPTCNSPIVSNPNNKTISTEDTESDLLTTDEFLQPLGNISLGLSDEHGHQVELYCLVTEPKELTSIGWNYANQHQISANVTLTLDLKCPIDRSSYEKLWRLIAYYSDVPAHLQREIMLNKDPYISYRYRQDVERDALYYTGVKANIAADPQWLMQSSIDLQLNRLQSTSKNVRLIFSTHISQVVEPEYIRQEKQEWVFIESRNDTRKMQVAVVGSPVEMSCPIHGSGNQSVKWMLPNGSTIKTPYSSGDNRISASTSGLFKIKSVGHSDSGVYYCIAQVLHDLSILPLRLTVEESSSPPPGDEGVTESITGFAGGAVSLPCVAIGSPDADINWIRPDGSIVNKWLNNSRTLVALNGTLIIRHSQLTDSGYYKCVAGNQHGMDTLVTKVIITRPPGILPLRKYFRGPQPAEGVSTKIKVLMSNDVESSGDDEPGEILEKTVPRRVDLPNRRRVPNMGTRGGHPSRNLWRRPVIPRRRVGTTGVDRVDTVESKKRNSVSNNQIDPKRWASILAKVRNGGTSPKTTTVNAIQSNTNRIQESVVAYTKHPDITNKIEGLSTESATTGVAEEIVHAVTTTQMPIQTNEYNLDIRPLDFEDQRHVIYQIAASESDRNPDLFTASTYMAQPSVVPQMSHFTFRNSEVANRIETSTSWVTKSHGNNLQENQNHLKDSGSVNEAILKPDGEDYNDEYRVSKSHEHGVEVYQGRTDHSLPLTTAKTHTEQSAGTHGGANLFTDFFTTVRQGTQALQKHTIQQKPSVSEIPLLFTATPISKSASADNKATFSNSLSASSSRARNSSSSRRRTGGRRKKPNRIRTKTNSFKSSVYFTISTPQPTSASIAEVTKGFSVVTKTTASSYTKIATFPLAKHTEAKMNTTVPLNDSQAQSPGKMTHEENTDPLYSGRNHQTHQSLTKEKASVTKGRHLVDATPAQKLKTTTPVSVFPSTSINFGREEMNTIMHKEENSTLSPLIRNPSLKAGIHWWFTSTHTPAAKTFKETQQESITGDSRPTSDHSLENFYTHPEETPGASSDKTNNQYKPTDTGTVLSSKEMLEMFTLRPFSTSFQSTQTENHSETSGGSVATAIFEGAQSLGVTTDQPQTSPVSTTKPHRVTAGSIYKDSVSSRNPWGQSNVNVLPVTEEITVTTTTSATTIMPPTLDTHMHTKNITSKSRVGDPDNVNHTLDSHEKFVTPGQETIPRVELRETYSRPPVTQFPNQLVNVSEDTTSHRLGVNIYKKTTTKTSTIPPESSTISLLQPKIPLRSGVQSSGSFPIHYTTSRVSQQRPTAVPEGRSRPHIISTDIKSVTAQAESDAYLPCVAVGKPSPFLSWTKVSTGKWVLTLYFYDHLFNLVKIT